MILRIDYEVLRHTYGENLFDMDTFQIYPKNSEDVEYLENYLHFPAVDDIECKRAFLEKLPKIPHKLIEKLDEDFDFWFWNIVDDGGKRLAEFDRFEKQYALKVITDWCDENYIPYYIDKSDDLLMYFPR